MNLSRLSVLGLLGFAAACVPIGRGGPFQVARDGGSVETGQDATVIHIDGGFDDAGNPVDGGTIVFDGGTLMPPDASVVAVVYDECPDNPHTLDIPIVVNDGANTVARDPGVTSFIVPFAFDEQLYSLNSLVVYDGTDRLPAQFEAIGRWDGRPSECQKPIRYAYAHVRAVPAPGAQAQWSVRSEADNRGESTTLSVTESAEAWVIDTGVSRFTVRRTPFQGLSKVELPNGGGGYDTISELTPNEPGFVVDHGGEETTLTVAPWYLTVEREGPQVVTVAARGFYAKAGATRDLGYTIRLHFYASSTVVRVEHTYYFGAVEGWGADGISNSTQIGFAAMRVPLTEATRGVSARGESMVHALGAQSARLEQEKRSPAASAVRFTLSSNGTSVEGGTFADRPYLAALGAQSYVLGVIGRMAFRDPQAIAYDATANRLELQFTSTSMGVGGARGIWSVAALDFGRGDPSAARADAVQLHAERPLLGVPGTTYLNSTATFGPYAESTAGATAAYFPLVADIHTRSRDYLREYKITGLQLWPDMPRASCFQDFNCDEQRNQLHEGGDNNYWNWSKPGIDEFFRTGNNDFIYDFSLGEAVTYVETLAVRTDHDRIADSSVMGLAPCYGSSRGFSGDYREGLNNRRDNCVADYSYDKTLKVAYLATGDRRFVDFYEEAAQSVVNAFGAPPANPEQYLEVTLNRLSEQRLEVLTAGAEFARDDAVSNELRGRLRTYVDYMLGRVLIDGHSCDVGGSGSNDAKQLGSCSSSQGWMMPVGVEWAMRSSRFLRHPNLTAWLRTHGARSAENHTVLGGDGLPDYGRVDGWRTVYQCSANGNGVVSSSCQKVNGGENGGAFYANGVVSYLNVFGLVLAADRSDPNRICAWLPNAYRQAITTIPDLDINFRIWGKASGQAFGMSAEAVGAISRCP